MATVIKGKGKIYENDDYLSDVYYWLKEVENPSEIKDISGEIEIIGDENLIHTIVEKGMSTLHLSDGRKLDFQISFGRLSSGRGKIRALGAFRE
jgi:hypothetical protein